jgi:parallel beta-helix repeat protein
VTGVTAALTEGGLLFDDSVLNEVRDVAANDNDGIGIALAESGSNTLSDISGNDNQRGFDLYLTANTTIENATATNNSEWAFYSEQEVYDETPAITAETLDIGSATISFAERSVTIAAVEDH